MNADPKKETPAPKAPTPKEPPPQDDTEFTRKPSRAS
jgi:hypothetical protein